MRRKSILLGICLVLLLTAVAALAVILVRYEPAYYRAGELSAGDAREKQSKDFYNAVSGLANDVT